MRYYTEDHLWVDVDGNEATVGVAEYLLEELGKIIAVELPGEEDDFIIGDHLGSLTSESNKNESHEVIAPLSGTVSQVNETLIDYPNSLNEDPESNGWLFKIVDIDPDEFEDMMEEVDYLDFLDKLP